MLEKIIAIAIISLIFWLMIGDDQPNLFGDKKYSINHDKVNEGIDPEEDYNQF